MLGVTAFSAILFLIRPSFCQQDTYKIVSIVDASLAAGPSWLEAGVAKAQRSPTNSTITNTVVSVAIDDETAAEQKLCQALYDGASLILDITAGGWMMAKEKAKAYGIPYVHAQISNYEWMSAADQLLQTRNSTDAALIFSNEAELDQALYYLVEGSVIRVIVLNGIQSNISEILQKMRPAPAHYVIVANSEDLLMLFDKAVKSGLVWRETRWLLVMTSPETTKFRTQLIPGSTLVFLMIPKDSLCCTAIAQAAPCSCSNVLIPRDLISNAISFSVRALKKAKVVSVKGDCGSNVSPASASTVSPPSASTVSLASAPTTPFYDALTQELKQWPGVRWIQKKLQISPLVELNIRTANSTFDEKYGEWSSDKGLKLNPKFEMVPINRFFKIGTIRSRPWMYEMPRNSDSSEKAPALEGYCYELTKKLADHMNFDYEFVFPHDGKYGAKSVNGSWNGLVGDLARGETDMIIAPLTMTSEREEVIDFVSPYFDQSGISIVIRKGEREESLFKFMTVLKAEVWVSIVAALVVTGIMLWFLDKYSPYSAQNSSEYQMQPYRKFTLKESFWFALTSFTPQGGGEAPKALSGRTLVAAYWLFVVLMLATFTANLAAFLTVERMQSPVQSLEALARQAKITFTTAKDNSVYEYFYNMAKAEDELFRVWKSLTLNSTSDQSKYRVWDYPIREQYTHILQVIDETKPLPDAESGLKKVVDSIDGDFAFIHDAAELRYEVYHSCYLMEVGEPFAEQPYAIAVKQGSHLQEELSRAILELQKDRYFEALTAKYWNSSDRGPCPTDDDSEGINLQSLGGVFIATLIGLVLALIALAVEVMYYRRIPEKEKDRVAVMREKIGGNTKSGTVSRINVNPAF